MRVLADSKIALKTAVPLIVMALVAGALAMYARTMIDALAARTVQIVDFQAARLDNILSARYYVNDAAIQARNLIVETREKERSDYKTRYDFAMGATYKAIDKLIELAETPERREKNLNIREAVLEYYLISDKAIELAFNNQNDAAIRLVLTDEHTARTKVRDAMRQRVEVLTDELAHAKADAQADAGNATLTLIVAAVVGLVSALVLSACIVVFGVTRPLGSLVSVLQRMARGDIDTTIAEAARGDEIGAVGRAVDAIKNMVARQAAEESERKRMAEEAAAAERKRTMIELADGFESAVGGIVGLVSSSATELQATAQQMTATAQETASQSVTVAAAAEEAAANVNTVSAAAEELGSSVQEIGRQVMGSADLARQAMGEADHSAVLVNDLNRAVARIGDVVQLISTIAAQTNLLALNATIEAARAGDAGRGFAVVAAEVKQLAGQTARATEEIGSQIGLIQGATGQAVGAIGLITTRIREINGVATTIAAAVEQQGAATQEIVRNVAQASTGTAEVTGNIAGVAQASEETGAAAGQVLSAASELSRQSEHLAGEVKRFLATVRAA